MVLLQLMPMVMDLQIGLGHDTLVPSLSEQVNIGYLPRELFTDRPPNIAVLATAVIMKLKATGIYL